MHVLIVEDEQRILNYLADALASDGHTTQRADTFESAKHTLTTAPCDFDVVLLDRMLGASDGADLITLIKSRRPHCKILILSALGDASEKALVLDKGADDYLSKPFTLTELSARIRALGRRSHSTTSGARIQLGNCTLDLVGHRLLFGHRPIDLSHKEFQVLVALAQHAGRVLSRYQLLDQVWNAQFEIESNVVEVTIRNLRKKLENNGHGLTLRSKRGLGYWLEA